jgi:hypothetical protein
LPTVIVLTDNMFLVWFHLFAECLRFLDMHKQ